MWGFRSSASRKDAVRGLAGIGGLLVAACLAASPATAVAGSARAKFILDANSTFDPYVHEAGPETQRFARANYWRARAYPPFFDRALGWAPRTHFYKDLYAIKPSKPEDQQLIADHPDWVLRDSAGNKLYIQFACNGSSCTQYAADIGNPGWRAHWLNQARASMSKGYDGIFVDDVNLEMKVSNGAGEFVRPMDPRTGAPMTDANWRRYVAEFTEQIRRAFPSAWISHNPLWWVPHSDPFLQRQIAAADAIELERGFSDRGLTNGWGRFGFMTFLKHIKWLHARGKSIIVQPQGLETAKQREFELASYFLVQRGDDAIASDDRAHPDNWWDGWSTHLGRARGKFHRRHGLLIRKFSRGIVAVNQPGSKTRKLKVKGKFVGIDGRRQRVVRLGAQRGAILLRSKRWLPKRR